MTAVTAAAASGFDAVELFLDDPSSIQIAELQSGLRNQRMNLAAVGTGAGKVLHGWTLTDPDAEIRKKARRYIAQVIRFGAQFSAPAIIGSMQGWVTKGVERERCLDWLAKGMEELIRVARDHGVGLIYEPLNRYETNIFNRIGDATSFIVDRQLRGGLVLADLFHMNIEEESIEQAIVNTGSFLGYVHLADSNRRPAGGGHIDIASVAGALRKIGYEGYVSAEAFAYPDSEGAAVQTMRAFRQWFS
jgi:sugar phosphate isomerase/epimerase